MLENLITSKTRIKLMVKFFLNPQMKCHLRGLSEEFGDSTNSFRVELNRLTQTGFLEASKDGRMKVYQANRKHVLFDDLQNIVKKYIGIDRLLEEVLNKLGDVKHAFITGDYARGIDSGIIDLIIVGNIDPIYLQQLVSKTEKLIGKKIHCVVMTVAEYEVGKSRFESLNIAIV